FVESHAGDGVTVQWDFYNSDGSRAAMCGNALRCMGRWVQHVLGLSEIRFMTARGPVTVLSEQDNFLAELTFVEWASKALTYQSDGATKSALLLNTGVPHAVVPVKVIDDAAAFASDVPALRFHPETGPAGTNVTFVEVQSPDQIRTVTFERGVEGFTLSCGTGVLAAAAVSAGIVNQDSRSTVREVQVQTPGGSLRVRFSADLKVVTLIGPAVVIGEGIIREEILR
ncbi:MAG: diaminopimelate epimerase, partial [Bdellovibrionaceae bacterium]|nr:diaminopimelate epimerase [Pseudobdellovibrionaceae bacterium]